MKQKFLFRYSSIQLIGKILNFKRKNIENCQSASQIEKLEIKLKQLNNLKNCIF
jgi:hypothetical protein